MGLYSRKNCPIGAIINPIRVRAISNQGEIGVYYFDLETHYLIDSTIKNMKVPENRSPICFLGFQSSHIRLVSSSC